MIIFDIIIIIIIIKFHYMLILSQYKSFVLFIMISRDKMQRSNKK